MIKYLGSKRRLVPLLTDLATACHAHTALDLFTGTTRVAQGWRQAGMVVTAVDLARYSEVLARTYVAWEPDDVQRHQVDDALAWLAARPARDGYVTETFCRQSRYFHPDNGVRIDAIREGIERRYRDTWMEPILLTALLEAADRVDSTTGVQMAYLKQWAPRALRPLELRRPTAPDGPLGVAIRADARHAVARLGPFDLAYLDPPYNQHRYFTNYHVWETLVAWDAPEHYGVACKRVDARGSSTRSAFNERGQIAPALAACIDDVAARVVVVSSNDEGWLSLDDVVAMLATRGPVEVLAVDSKRYVGAQIGIYDPQGRKVGRVSHLRNTEYVVVGGNLTPAERDALRRVAHRHGAVMVVAEPVSANLER